MLGDYYHVVRLELAQWCKVVRLNVVRLNVVRLELVRCCKVERLNVVRLNVVRL